MNTAAVFKWLPLLLTLLKDRMPCFSHTDIHQMATVLFDYSWLWATFRFGQWCGSPAFAWLTPLRRHPSADVQLSWILQRPKPSRCLSGCPGKRHSGTWIRGLRSTPAFSENNCSGGYVRRQVFWTTDEDTRSLLEELCVRGPPGATLQMSSPWADTFWMVSQRRSRQKAHSYNTWWRNGETIIIV